jgi:hypothetical protein
MMTAEHSHRIRRKTKPPRRHSTGLSFWQNNFGRKCQRNQRPCFGATRLAPSPGPSSDRVRRRYGGEMVEWFVAKAAKVQDDDRHIATAGPQETGVFFKHGAPRDRMGAGCQKFPT